MKYRSILAILFLALLALAGCGDDEGSISQPGGGGDDGSGGDETVDVRIGNGSGNNFEEGVLALGMETISSGGTTSVSGTLVDSAGSLVNESYEVEFTSTCVENGQATINSPRSSVDGEFETTYTASDCTSSDSIEATVSLDDETTITASATVQIEPGDLGSINFTSAEPSSIALKGMGGVDRSETSRVTFQVRDVTGAGIPDQDVSFTLSTQVGGIELTADSATSDSDGLVATTVQSGTVATPVRVSARVDNTEIGTQSERIFISTGIPEENGFSVSAEKLNPEAWGCDGEEVNITIRARDRFSNPVVDGTVIQFNTEGASIEPACLTENGVCTVTWRSQDPRPTDSPAMGRSSVVAFAIGEETFTDRNGDGRFGNEEFNNGNWMDTGEPFRDDNENGTFDPGVDGFFFDFDEDGSRTGPNGLFDGVLCTADSGCGEPTTAVGRTFVMTMSTSVADISFPSGGSHSISGDGSLEVLVQDLHGNPMPAGTTVSVDDISYGDTVGPDSFTFGSTNALGPFSFIFALEPEEDPGCGTAVIAVQTPGNACNDGTTTYDFIEICD